MSWNLYLTNLQDILSDLYPSTADAIRVAREAGMSIKLIGQSEKPINTWHNVLMEADHHSCLGAVLAIAIKDYPDNYPLEIAREGKLSGVQGAKIGDTISWKAAQPSETLEKIIGRASTLLPISFFELGLRRSKGVVRITRQDGACGTGFLIAGNLILTNHHVLPTLADAESAVLHFNCQRSPEGLDLPMDEFTLDPHSVFLTNASDDWTAVRVTGDPGSRWDPIPLLQCKTFINDNVNIIQHPEGGAKQIGIAHNFVVYVGDGRVQYLTDTLPGSSGAPVFNNSWDLVAVHHSGGYISEPSTTRLRYRNEGIAVSVVYQAIRSAGLLPS